MIALNLRQNKLKNKDVNCRFIASDDFKQKGLRQLLYKKLDE